MYWAAADPNPCTEATPATNTDGVENIILGLNFVVFPNVARAAGGSIGLNMAGAAEGHAHLIFIKADCNLTAADEALFGGGVAVELCSARIDPLTGCRAAADKDDRKHAEQLRYFHDG